MTNLIKPLTAPLVGPLTTALGADPFFDGSSGGGVPSYTYSGNSVFLSIPNSSRGIGWDGTNLQVLGGWLSGTTIRVRKYTAAGSFVSEYNLPGFDNTFAIACSTSNVWVGEWFNSRLIREYDLNGNPTGRTLDYSTEMPNGATDGAYYDGTIYFIGSSGVVYLYDAATLTYTGTSITLTGVAHTPSQAVYVNEKGIFAPGSSTEMYLFGFDGVAIATVCDFSTAYLANQSRGLTSTDDGNSLWLLGTPDGTGPNDRMYEFT